MTLLVKENQKLTPISYTIRLNKHLSVILATLYKSRCFKHRKFDQSFEIKAQNSCYPCWWRPQKCSGTGRDPII